MANIEKIKFPLGKIYMQKGSRGIAYIEYNNAFISKFNKNLDKVQVFLDEEVIKNLTQYVSFRKGVQEASIILSSIPRIWKSTYKCSLCRISSLFKKNKKESRQKRNTSF